MANYYYCNGEYGNRYACNSHVKVEYGRCSKEHEDADNSCLYFYFCNASLPNNLPCGAPVAVEHERCAKHSGGEFTTYLISILGSIFASGVADVVIEQAGRVLGGLGLALKHEPPGWNMMEIQEKAASLVSGINDDPEGAEYKLLEMPEEDLSNLFQELYLLVRDTGVNQHNGRSV
ncbi:hypothetical protein [Salinicola avicenniae]|uniref:hypothetical protein n=1 Tax=Salinicola avicenniae TaxID=2916836 RepID=UPI0020743FCC|nr:MULTISPECIES: hypothetical protein [unclassified Salinicola]